MDWHEGATIFYDWVRYGEDLSGDYVEDVVQKAVNLHVDTLAFCVQVGGYALWDSQVTPKYSRIGGLDLIGELARLCRERGLHFVPWWLGTALGVERVLREHPSWQLVGPPRGDQPPTQHNYVCYNSPYRELLYEEIREILQGYEADGIYFDQLPGSCYCPWCRAKFERRYGQPMPVVEDEFFVYNTAAGLPPLLRTFRDESVRGFCSGVRQIIDEVRPGVVYAQNWVRNQQAHLGVGLVDVLLPEFYQKDNLAVLGMKHRLTHAYFNDGSIWGNVRHSVRHDARHHPLAGTRMLLADCVANYASPLLLDLCAMDFDATGQKELAETFDHIRAVQPMLAAAEPVRYAALLHSRKSHELGPERYDEAFEGMYSLLLEAHVPFEIVHEDAVAQGALQDYKVLVIPDAVSLADSTVAAIRAAAADGLGVVATHMTGLVDGQGRRRSTPALADLFGFEFEDVIAFDARKPKTGDPVLALPDMGSEPLIRYGSVRPTHELTQGFSASGRFGFGGGFVVAAAGEEVEVVADVHATDQARMHGRPYNRPGVFPGPPRWPLAIARQTDAARLVYVTAQVDAIWRRAHAPELDSLLRQAVLWAGGPCPLDAADCPPSVELRLFHNSRDRQLHILLVNLTTSPLVRVSGGPGVIRHVIPHKQLRLALRTEHKPLSVHSLTGAKVCCNESDGALELGLSRLDLYEAISVRLT